MSELNLEDTFDYNIGEKFSINKEIPWR